MNYKTAKLDKGNYRALASRQDKRVAKESGMHVVTNSGATAGRKGDLKRKGKVSVLVETKTAEKPRRSFTIQKDWLTKLYDQAFSMMKEFHYLVFTFDMREDFAVLPAKDLYNLINELDELRRAIDEDKS